MLCAICNLRRARRYCPGVKGEICAICCGTEREVTISCPFDCVYLREARRHEKPPLPAELPNSDIHITDEMIDENQELFGAISYAIVKAADDNPGTVDFDVREALAGLIRTYRTLQSGIYFETRPGNLLAQAVYEAVQTAVAAFRADEQRRTGFARTRDAVVLRLLVFLQKYEYALNNGRKKGRAVLDALHEPYRESDDAAPPPSSLILP